MARKRKEKNITVDSKYLEKLRKKKSLRENLSLMLLALPGLVLLIIFSYLPMPGIIIAFKNYIPLKGIWGSEWVGLENFRFFFQSQDAFRTIRNTVLYSIAFLILDLICGVGIALMLFNLKKKISVKIYNTIILLPKFLSIVLVAFIVYAILSPSYGFLNSIIRFFGGTNIQWYSKASYWPVILTITHIWMTLGSGCLFYYAALVGIDGTLFEAARLDGANKWQETVHVSIPALVPIMVIMTILGIGGLFSGDFGLFYQVPKDQGLLYPTTDIINTYTFRALFDGNLAKSTAVNLFQSLVGLILVVVTNGIVRKVSPENSMF